MGLEKRGNGLYYYTAERVGRRVVKTYIGAGRVAAIAAQFAADLRAEREATAEAAERAKAELDTLDAALAPLNELADAATAAALVAAGCHRPKRGKWRKRRA